VETRGDGGANVTEVRLLSGRVRPVHSDPAPSRRLLRGGFSARGATREGIIQAAEEDYRAVLYAEHTVSRAVGLVARIGVPDGSV
jgi:hypothetical protein